MRADTLLAELQHNRDRFLEAEGYMGTDTQVTEWAERQRVKKAMEHQVGGNHYKNKSIQPIDYIIGNNLGFCEGNVIKYVTRYKDKNGVEDLLKAKQYLEFLIKDWSKTMEADANEYFLNKHLDEQEKQEKEYLAFENEAYEIIKELKIIAKTKYNYDFSDELEEIWSNI